MNKIIVPSIFAGIVIVAAAFAVMPIEKASTVHTTIGTNINDQNRALHWTVEGTAGTTLTVIPNTETITGTATLSTIDGAGTCEIRPAGGANDSGPIDNLALGNALTGTLTSVDGLDIAIEGGTSTCSLTVFVDSLTG